MSQRPSPKVACLMAVAALGVASTACDILSARVSIDGIGTGVQGTFAKTLTVAGPVDLTVHAGSGSISIQPGGGAQVTVTGRIRTHESWHTPSVSAHEKVKRLEQIPPIAQSGDTITIGEITDGDLRDNVTITYEIVAPASTRIRARCGSGSIQIGDFSGPVDASDGSGSIRVGRIADRVSASSGSGSIHIAGANGAIDAQAGSGSIELVQTGPGAITVSSGSGGITIRGASGPVTASSGSGSITADGTVAADWKLNTSSGSLTLTIPPTAAFDLDARTSSGRVESDHPITMAGEIDRRHLQGKVRGGGPRLQLRSSSGSIRIR